MTTAEQGEKEVNTASRELDSLLFECSLGNELAWENLVRKYQARVYGVAYHYLGNADDAHDAAQEIFVKIYRKRKKWPPAAHFFPWLIRVTRNCCIDQLRKKRSQPRSASLRSEDLRGLKDSHPNPENLSSQAARKRTIHRALQALTELNREIIILKEIQGLTVKEAARILKVPIGTIKSRSHRARLELAEKLVASGEI